ncbi:MAG: peptidoglycan DD-metalloendopeptidase family protein, partial [Desulfitobacterium hafniense]|nr:peptidoglycan DD-metalloendopeptidase family protein [Desulfitobacterium hafniense]
EVAAETVVTVEKALEILLSSLTVVSQGIRTETEKIPFNVVTKTDYNLVSGQTKVSQYGSDGQKEVKYSYVQRNGKIISKTVLDEKVIKAAVPQIVLQGPQRTSAMVGYSRGSGQLSSGMIWPLRGRITSYFGYRGSEFHTAIDIEGNQGDPFVAAASGTVISTGWDGGYGNSILIDHGNGVKTRYAHCSELLVTPGQSISKGDKIGTVGSTGRATGSHLHFEVIINEDYTNPLNYLSRSD